MAKMSEIPPQAFIPEAAAAAQNCAVSWSRAITHLTEGFVTAAQAQAALASQVFKAEPNIWSRPITPETAGDMVSEWFATNKAKQAMLLQGVRRINDDLTASFYGAAEELTKGLSVKSSKSESPATTAKPESRGAASAVEKKTTAPE